MSKEAPAKRPAGDAADGDNDSESAAKRPRLEESNEGEGVPSGEQAGASGEGVSGAGAGASSESDEEYQADSGEEVLSDEGESSDAEGEGGEEVEEEEGSGDEPEPNIICGTQVEVKAIKDGKYSLFQKEDGREFKMIISDQDREGAEGAIEQKQKSNIIPVIDATGIEIAKDNEDELIVYVDAIGTGSDGYPFYAESQEDDKEKSMLQGNVWAVVKVEGYEELFATCDLTTT